MKRRPIPVLPRFLSSFSLSPLYVASTSPACPKTAAVMVTWRWLLRWLGARRRTWRAVTRGAAQRGAQASEHASVWLCAGRLLLKKGQHLPVGDSVLPTPPCQCSWTPHRLCHGPSRCGRAAQVVDTHKRIAAGHTELGAPCSGRSSSRTKSRFSGCLGTASLGTACARHRSSRAGGAGAPVPAHAPGRQCTLLSSRRPRVVRQASRRREPPPGSRRSK